ncbi:DNA-binding protein [Rheinheimera sp.]|uniref:DNA-binding protein n=1 Tax=Rheinheimera sp. TaxID=1869214 RepID=UPI004048BFA9
MEQPTGFFIRGEYMGTRIAQSKPDNSGQTKDTLYCGVKHFSEGKYGPEEHITELCISKGLTEKGVAASLHKFTGKMVELPFFEMKWSNGNGKTLFLANDVVNQLQHQPVKAAS